VLALLASILGNLALDEPCHLLTSTTLLRALGPFSEITLAIDGTRLGVVAYSGVQCLVAVRARAAAVRSVMYDGVRTLCHAVATGSGTLTEV